MRLGTIYILWGLYVNTLTAPTNDPSASGGSSINCLLAGQCELGPCYRCCCCYCQDFDGGEVCGVGWWWKGDCSCVALTADSQSILSDKSQYCSCD
ncbi:hypothetical protein BDV24DRAFT_140221 [Aspergillus arachidicola]|uniref:Uncharacterized protein n=1 Tax=Aspergillus arachidicola TaxID=656916 RepID=A0A5N6XY76_9EURO|nr:hypothetical protein BDV24DRAFT_140221 [Aspergillus arachidicola]